MIGRRKAMRLLICPLGRPVTPAAIRMVLWQMLRTSPPYRHARVCIERQLMRALAAGTDWPHHVSHEHQTHERAPVTQKSPAELHRLRW